MVTDLHQTHSGIIKMKSLPVKEKHDELQCC